MRYRVVFFCPDTHIKYDGRVPNATGVGGGITIRVRMAHALSRAGHRVVVVCNCPRRVRVSGVQYVPLAEVGRVDTDILILNTSGGTLDLSPILELDVNASFRAVWIQGTSAPQGLEEVGYDYVYAASNFLRTTALEGWGVPAERLFVAYNGYEEAAFRAAERRGVKRDSHRIVYFSHPSKGLDTAVDVVRRLRGIDSRFHLAVYGGNRLWGDPEGAPRREQGVDNRGLVGQKKLARELHRCTYCFSLQHRPEPFGMVVIEAMRAGCVVLASQTGAYPELILHGENGFVVPGDHRLDTTRRAAAEVISRLARNADGVRYVRRNARAVNWDTDTMASVWPAHWEWWMERNRRIESQRSRIVEGGCKTCGEDCLSLADGYHCVSCGRYSRRLTEAQNGTGQEALGIE